MGLPDGQMGNSEVGHLNMGAGRIVYQDLTKITKAIGDGRGYFAYAYFLYLCLQLAHESHAGSGRNVPAVHKAVYVHLFRTSL